LTIEIIKRGSISRMKFKEKVGYELRCRKRENMTGKQKWRGSIYKIE
jgi:hypothetical protein